jgi:hypothetical protein
MFRAELMMKLANDDSAVRSGDEASTGRQSEDEEQEHEQAAPSPTHRQALS